MTQDKIENRPRRVAIVGAGYSGTALAINLFRKKRPFDIVLIDRSKNFGRGVAYSTPYSYHLLNVPAGKMSALDDDPDHLVRWLAENKPGQEFSDSGEPIEKQFVPRNIFGQYLESLLEQTKNPSDMGTRLRRLRAEVTSIEKSSDQWTLRFSEGKEEKVDAVVLATGNEAPKPFFKDLPEDRALNNPWNWDILRSLAKKGPSPIMIIGTGLTMVDVALTLSDEGYEGKILALSRRGLTPRRHLWNVVPTSFDVDLSDISSPEAVFDQIWQHLSKNPTEDWRAVIDSLRPHTQTIWKHWSQEGKETFLKKYRPYWDVRRHRIAPEIAQKLNELLQRERLEIISGRIKDVFEKNANELAVVYETSGRLKNVEERVLSGIINCTGPNNNLKEIPLLNSLLDAGVIRENNVGLCIDVDDEGAVLNAQGEAWNDLFAMGPLTKSQLWEIVAVPDIRGQAARLADKLALE